MAATLLNLTIEQGAQFSQSITLGANTWDGQTARAQIRDRFNGALLATLTCSAIASGVVTLSLTTAQAAALVAPASARADERTPLYGFYVLEAVNSGEVTRLREGKVYLSRQVAP